MMNKNLINDVELNETELEMVAGGSDTIIRISPTFPIPIMPDDTPIFPTIPRPFPIPKDPRPFPVPIKPITAPEIIRVTRKY